MYVYFSLNVIEIFLECKELSHGNIILLTCTRKTEKSAILKQITTEATLATLLPGPGDLLQGRVTVPYPVVLLQLSVVGPALCLLSSISFLLPAMPVSQF